MTANPNRSLRDVVLQRQLWSYLKALLDNDILTPTVYVDKEDKEEIVAQPQDNNAIMFNIVASDLDMDCAEDWWSQDQREEIAMIDIDLRECSGAPRSTSLEHCRTEYAYTQQTTPPPRSCESAVQSITYTALDSITPHSAGAACSTLSDLAEPGPFWQKHAVLFPTGQ